MILLNVKYFYVIVILFLTSPSYSQFQTIYTNFTEETGLTSNECYTIFESSSGDIWIGTDNGLSRYNGQEFENYSYRDGLGSNSVFQIHEDTKGRIWFLTDIFALSYFEDDTIKSYKYNDLLSEYNKKKIQPLSINVKDNTVLIGTNSMGAIKIDSVGNKKVFFKENSTLLFATESGCAYATCKTQNDKIASIEPASSIVRLYSESWESFEEYKIATNTEKVLFTRASRRDDQYFFNLNSTFLHLNSTSRAMDIFQMEKIISIGNNGKELILGAMDGKNKLYDPELKLMKKFPLFDGIKISKTLVDGDKGLWIATLNNGVFYCPKSSLEHSFNTSGQNISALETYNDSLFIGTFNGDEYFYHHGKITRVHMESKEFSSILIRFSLDNKQKTKPFYPKDLQAIEKSLQYQDRAIFLDTYHHIIIVYRDKRFVFDGQEFVDITSSQNETYAIGFGGKLFRVADSSMVQIYQNNKFQFNRIESFRKGLLLGTRNEGLLYYEDGDVSHFEFNPNNGISVRSIYTISDTSFLYGTEKGLHFLSFSKKDKSWHNYNLNTNDGLKSNLVRFVEVLNDTIYFTTTDLVYRFPISAFNEDFGKLEVRNLSFNGDKTDFEHGEQNYTLENANGKIKVGVSTNNYLPNKVFIRYRLSIDEDAADWSLIHSNEILLQDLQWGSYKLEVCASSNGQNFGTSKTISFTKLPPWYLKPKNISLFILLVVFLVVGMVYIISELNKKSLKRKLAIKKVQLNSLNNQLNPHFLFNILSSIQTLVIKNEKKEAVSYLAEFAAFLRSNLNSFELEEVTLFKEIQLITSYLELEKLRFKEKLNYEIFVDENVDEKSTFLLPFISQPLIENAIIHGISNLNYQGKITLSFKRRARNLIIEIEDNGVGIGPESIGKSSNKGIGIVRERLAVWSKDSSLEFVEVKQGTLARIKMKL